MNLNEFKLEIASLVAENPDLADDLWDLYFIAEDEVESGGSISNEIHLAQSSIEDLLER